ncbi:MAG: DUF4293 domain-containing protein [Mangrovibacterium sp.]
MIQRIQTLYMLLSSVLIGLLFALPFAEIVDASNQIYTFNVEGVQSASGELIQNGWAVALLIGIMLLLQVVAIFMYKKRILQIRLLNYVILLIFGLTGLLFFFVLKSFDGAVINYQLSMVFPIIAAILNYLAIRAIGKDEALIRSVDRIR